MLITRHPVSNLFWMREYCPQKALRLFRLFTECLVARRAFLYL